MQGLRAGNLKGRVGLTDRWMFARGEFRAPRKGEYFLSGATPTIYYTNNDLGLAYRIMKPIMTVDQFKKNRI